MSDEKGKLFKHRLRVRYCETDQMGVVYYANYLVWFEVARTEIFRELGINYKAIEDQGIILPAVESHVRYLSSAHFDEEIEMHSRITDLRNASMTFSYKAFRISDKKDLADGYTRHAFLTKDRKIIHVPVQIQTILKGIISN